MKRKEKKSLAETVVDAVTAASEITESSSVLSRKRDHLDRLYELSMQFIDQTEEEEEQQQQEGKNPHSTRMAPTPEKKQSSDSSSSSFMDMLSCTGLMSICGTSSSVKTDKTEVESFGTPPGATLLERDIYSSSIDATIPSIIDVEFDPSELSRIDEYEKSQTTYGSSGMNNTDSGSQDRTSSHQVVVNWKGPGVRSVRSSCSSSISDRS